MRSNTVQCHYNAFNFLPNPHNRHPIICPWRGVSKIWLTFCHCYHSVIYCDKLDCVITALDCIWQMFTSRSLPSLDMHWSGERLLTQEMSENKIINSLAPGRPICHFKTAIFNLVLLTGIFTSSNDNALRWMPRDLPDDKSTLVQVMAWCRQATSHYLSQYWPNFMLPYGVTRPQLDKLERPFWEYPPQ